MNYFAHGRDHVDDPYFLAGTAVPDWLSVVDRGLRLRGKHALLHTGHADQRVAHVAAGIVRHCQDDAWFHETRAFAELSLELCRRLRERLPADDGFRPHFVGHILVEILLDATLIAEDSARLEQYYSTVKALDASAVQDAVNCIGPRATQRLSMFIRLFAEERFLFDYADDVKLWFRLNQVMRRARLPQLPEDVRAVFPVAREMVASRRDELLTPAEVETEALPHR